MPTTVMDRAVVLWRAGALLALVALVLLTIVYASGCSFIKGGDKGEAHLPKLYNDWTRTTPMGNAVSAKNELPMWWLVDIDTAIYNVTSDARAIYGDLPELRHSGYTVYVIPGCTPSPVYGTRSFKVNGVLAAEWVPNPEVKAFVVCDAPAPDQDLRNALRYGPEHIILRQFDYARYEATMQPDQHVHPLIKPAVTQTDVKEAQPK